MRKSLVIVLAAATLSLSLTACGNKANNEPSKVEDQQVAITDSLELLNNVWAGYADEEKFPAAGGDFSEENNTMDAPGVYSIEDAEAVDYALGFPAADIDKIDGAASLTHMMNANTFTCGAYHVKDSKDIETLAADIKENIMNRQWMCGFPDKLVVANVGDYLVAFFGKNETMDTFQNKLTDAYPSVTIISEDTIE